MRLNREQYGTIAEIKDRARRLYRRALQAEKTGIVQDDAVAEMYIDGQIAGQFTAILWKQCGEQTRDRDARLAPTPTEAAGEPEAELQAGEDDPLA